MTQVRHIPVGYNFAMAHVGHEGDECVIWPYSCCTPGYGTFSYQHTRHLAHRFMCEQTHGAPPTARHQAAHSCGNRRCINPRHIRWKTPSDNQKERRVHGTHTHKNSRRLTQRQADQIRALKGVETSVETAARYGVTESNVRLIQDGQTWKDDRKIHYFKPHEDEAMREGSRAGKSWREIAEALGRSEDGVYSRAHRIGLIPKMRLLTPEQMAEIRSAKGWGKIGPLAKKHGVGRATISRIRSGETYRSARG